LSRAYYEWRDAEAITMLVDDQQAVAQQMSVGALKEVLLVAAASRASQLARRLFQLPNVQQLGVDVLLQLLSAAVGAGLDSGNDDDEDNDVVV
jgi:hypothetical protein